VARGRCDEIAHRVDHHEEAWPYDHALRAKAASNEAGPSDDQIVGVFVDRRDAGLVASAADEPEVVGPQFVAGVGQHAPEVMATPRPSVMLRDACPIA
jgi:hypothetical protein